MRKLFIPLFLVLSLAISGCGSDGATAKGEEKEAEKKEEKSPIEIIEEALAAHQKVKNRMKLAAEQAEKGDEEKAQGAVEVASMFSDLALNTLLNEDLPPKDEIELIKLHTSVVSQLKIHAAAIDGTKQLIDKGVPTQKALNDFYDEKSKEPLDELEKLEGKIGDFK